MSEWGGGERGQQPSPGYPPPPTPEAEDTEATAYGPSADPLGWGSGQATPESPAGYGGYGNPPAGYGYPPAGAAPTSYSPPPAQDRYAEPTYAVGTAARPRRRFGVVGTLAALVGGGMVAVSFTQLDWLAPGHSSFRNIHNSLLGSGATYSKYYFDWLGWVALGVVVFLALIANLPTVLHVVFRPLGALAAIAAIGATVYAVEQIPGGTWSRVYHYGTAGLGLAVVGFAVVGVGALVGPGRARRD